MPNSLSLTKYAAISPFQQIVYPINGCRPTLFLLTGQSFECFDCSLGRAFGLQVLCQDCNIVVQSLKVVALHGPDALHQVVGIRSGLYGLSGNSIDKRQRHYVYMESSQIGPRQFKVDILAARPNGSDDIGCLRTFRDDLIPNLGSGGGSGAAADLRAFPMLTG
jgi:hypothetical protein